jgi:hypothetical protein
MKVFAVLCSGVLFATSLAAAPKQHVVAFGKWTTVKLLAEDDESAPVEIKVRPLFVDGRTKEFTIGTAHDVTDRVFVVQWAYRVNDLLPQDEEKESRWRWERGGWLMVDRVSGRAQSIALPAFDAYFSEVAWFRNYAAYCGVSEDGKKVLTVVAQLGKRKPLLKRAVGENRETTGRTCAAPSWLRAPARVTFEPAGDQKFTFTLRSHTVDLVTAEDDEGED